MTTKPKGEKPRERAAKGDTSNEGAQACRSATAAKVRRMKRWGAALTDSSPDWKAGYAWACDEVLAYLSKQTERFSVRKGGLRGPGKVARRA